MNTRRHVESLTGCFFQKNEIKESTLNLFQFCCNMEKWSAVGWPELPIRLWQHTAYTALSQSGKAGEPRGCLSIVSRVYSQAVIAANPALFGALPMTTLFPLMVLSHSKSMDTVQHTPVRSAQDGSIKPLQHHQAWRRHQTSHPALEPFHSCATLRQPEATYLCSSAASHAHTRAVAQQQHSERCRGAAGRCAVAVCGTAALTALPSQHPAARAGSSHEIRLLWQQIEMEKKTKQSRKSLPALRTERKSVCKRNFPWTVTSLLQLTTARSATLLFCCLFPYFFV